MINEELKTFINKMRAVGKTDPEIAAELKTAGWGEEDITLALNPQPVLTVDSQSPARLDLQEEKGKTKSHRSIWIWFALIIAAFLVGGYITFRVLPYLWTYSLRKQGTFINKTVSIPAPAPNSKQTTVSFPNNIIRFQIPPTWYQKEELHNQTSYRLDFAEVNYREDESKPPLVMAITVNYPGKENSSLVEVVDIARKSFLETQQSGAIAVATILSEHSSLMDGISAYQFDYKVDINKKVTNRKKQSDGSWTESTNFVTRVDRGRQIIFFDSQKNMYVVTLVALEKEWSQFEPDFQKVVESMNIKNK